MAVPKALRTILKWPVKGLMALPAVRRPVAFELTQSYFHELGVSVPLGGGLSCPIVEPDAFWSFAEIFVNQDYRPAFDLIAPPRRWLDLGCHMGHFSLFAIWMRQTKRATEDFQALLVDADGRVERSVSSMISTNGLSGRLNFMTGLIAAGTGGKKFVSRSHMASSLAGAEDEPGVGAVVDVLTPEAILTGLAPPYDLIKVDMEGAEFDFLNHYQPVLEHARLLIVEWHSWHKGGGGKDQIDDLARQAGFSCAEEIAPARAVTICGVERQCGITLYARDKHDLIGR